MALLKEVFVIREGPSDTVNPKVEKLMNSTEVSQFVETDWLELGLLALDQAGLSLVVQNKIEKMARDDMPESVGAQANRAGEADDEEQAPPAV